MRLVLAARLENMCQPCTATVDGVCSECPPGTFQPDPEVPTGCTKLHATTMSQCSCAAGTFAVVPCIGSTNVQCETCPEGRFQPPGILVEVNAGRAHAVLQASTHPECTRTNDVRVQRAQQDSFRSTCCSPVQRAQSAMGAVPESTRQSRVQTSLPMCA